MNMRRLLPLALAALAAACGTDVAYRPSPLLIPQHIQRLSLRPVINKTQQFGLEDKLSLRVRDEFLRDGRYPLVPEAEAQGTAIITISRYVLTPVQFDSTLNPVSYKLRIIVDVQFLDRASNQILWEERNLEGILTYPAAILAGGKTEEQAREQIWDILARNIVKRVIQGYGSVTGTSQRRVSPDAPSTAPVVKPEEKLEPVIKNPY
jgi:hypothetical protein